MCPQAGIYPRVIPGVHTHETVNQGGTLDWVDAINNKPYVDAR